MIKQLLFICSFLTVALASAADVVTIGNEDFDVDTIFHVTTGPGVQTTGIRLTGRAQSNASVSTNIFYTAIDLRNPTLELRGVQALDTECASENILRMGTRKNNDRADCQYIAGINGDHANLYGDHKRTNGISVIDNQFYNYGMGDSNWKQFASYVAVENGKDITITDNLETTIPLTFANGTYHIHINSPRSENYLVIYTPEYGVSTNTNVWGYECTMKLVSGSIVGQDAVFEITSGLVGECNNNPADGNIAIPADGYVLSGVGAAYKYLYPLKIGDRISMRPLEIKIDGTPARSMPDIIGGCPIIVDDGVVISAAECEKLNKKTLIQTTPTARTAVGYNQERTKIYLLVADFYTKNKNTDGDKATYGATSSGLDFVRLGHFMVHLGCHTATAMDGGGSSQLYSNGMGICNIPYGEATYLRPVANGFFAVSITPDDYEIAEIEVVQKNVKLNEGEKFTPRVYGYNKYGVLVDTDIADFNITVDPSLGTVDHATFSAGSLKAATIAIVSHGKCKCGVRIYLNGGGLFVSSGENVNLEAPVPYLDDNQAGIDDVYSDEETPVYYNLQGIRVSNPGKGVFIVKHGKSVFKEYR